MARFPWIASTQPLNRQRIEITAANVTTVKVIYREFIANDNNYLLENP